jgi:hypothetical protein
MFVMVHFFCFSLACMETLGRILDWRLYALQGMRMGSVSFDRVTLGSCGRNTAFFPARWVKPHFLGLAFA